MYLPTELVVGALALGGLACLGCFRWGVEAGMGIIRDRFDFPNILISLDEEQAARTTGALDRGATSVADPADAEVLRGLASHIRYTRIRRAVRTWSPNE